MGTTCSLLSITLSYVTLCDFAVYIYYTNIAHIILLLYEFTLFIACI